MKLKFTKNGREKLLDEGSKLIPFIVADGWEVVKDEEKPKRKKKEKSDDNSA